MKKLSIIMAAILLLAMSFSCSEEFLTKEPLGSTSENVFYDEKGIDALLIGTYAMVTGSSLWEVSWGASIQNWTYGSAASDDAYKGSEVGDQAPANEIERWEVLTTNNYPADKWRLNIGMGIDRANKTMRIINASEEQGTIDAATANSFRAEVRFLRGLFNFEAWLVFGDYIPILTEDTEDPAQVPNENPEGAVLNHIISDLEFAWNNLPATQSQVGRATKYAAMALGARAYLQDLQYSAAKPLLDNIINSRQYELMPNFIDNFNIETENNAESIFEIQANVNDIEESLNAEMGIGLNFPHGSDIGMCCGFHQPSQNLVNAFKVDENGLPMFDTFNDEDLKNDQGVPSEETFVPTDHPVDPRLDWTVSRRGIPYKDWGINRGRDWIRKQPEGGPYMPASKPFFKKSERYSLSTTTGWQTGVNANNYRYLRYSHVLLWRAEVAAFEGDLETARTYVNMIRERAGNDVVMGKVLIYELPPDVWPWGEEGDVDWDQPAANYEVGLYDSFADKNEAMEAVQWEQRLEFATEGLRFFDLRRWDNLPNKIGGKSMAEVLNEFAQADLRIRDFMEGKEFSPGTDKYQPIPQGQLDLQPGVLVQRPGY
jgi:hypothetical protein